MQLFFRFIPLSIFTGLGLICFLFSCNHDTALKNSDTLFSLVDTKQSGITFQNKLDDGPNTNILMYEYFYNGGGVAVGDFNKDGLDDVYFTSNMRDNALYLNQGNMQFKDITNISGAAGRPGPWKTGVTTVDINNDGLLDIYLSYSGMLPPEKRTNQLFVNQGISANGNPLFKDMAAEYGLASNGYSNQAYFFDYDVDGDLDMLLLNHNPKNLPILNESSTAIMLAEDDKDMGLRLYKQKDGKFVDVTTSSGINGSALSYGLSIGIADLNRDGYPDFYVSNDYTICDYLYINNKNGGFTNQLKNSLSYTSQFSMGNDLADYNNDGLADIFTLDMLPEDNKRQKLLLGADNYQKFDQNVRNGFYYQYMRNMLHLNNGDGSYSEIAQLAGVSNTDWSWSALLADYDNDGYKDLFVSNGYVRDYTNMDFIKYMENYTKEKGRINKGDVLNLIQKMPASNVSNYIFKNKGNLTFGDMTETWGMKIPSNSNGAAYADLDNDGDLDMIVNNVNQAAFIYQNNSKGSHYLKIKLKGNKTNIQALGTKVTAYHGTQMQYFELYPTRGYLSSVSPTLNIGLGTSTQVDSLIVLWPDQKMTKRYTIDGNTSITIDYSEATRSLAKSVPTLPISIFEKDYIIILQNDLQGAAWRDFDRQALLPREYSHDGSCMTSGDLNGDGREDLFVGGGLGQKSAIYLQDKNNKFSSIKNESFAIDALYHDAAAHIVDIDKDGDNDLIVASGGYHDLAIDDSRLEDRLYINDKNKSWTKTSLPQIKKSSKSCIATGDLNGDGVVDIFIGGRIIPGRYPETPSSNLYLGTKEKVNVSQYAFGMVTDAAIKDLNGDKIDELIVVGEYMPISIYNLVQGKLVDNTSKYLDKQYTGWWQCLSVEDVDKDGRYDLIAGNQGHNSQLKTKDSEKIELIFGDFDKNGSIDSYLQSYIQDTQYPYVTKEELGVQIPMLNKQYTSFESYSTVTTQQLLKHSLFKDEKKLSATHMESMVFYQSDKNKFNPQPLPLMAQVAPIKKILPYDYDDDGDKDLILVGNDAYAKIRLGKSMANNGIVLTNDGKGKYASMPYHTSGLRLREQYQQGCILGDLVVLRSSTGEVRGYKRK